MNVLWCWRCKSVQSMLDEDEYEVIGKLYGDGMYAPPEFRQRQGIPSGPISREIRLLRGDCLLHLEDRTTALDAFTAAEKSPDPTQMAEARAAVVLIRNSTGLLFTPKPPAEGPAISIVDHAGRKAAMLALNTQLLADSRPLIDKALTAPNLVPIIDATPTLIDIHSLEMAATGSSAEIRPTMIKIAEHARELMSNELGMIDGRITRIESKANQLSDVPVYGGWWAGRQGLTSDDREALRDDAAYADRIASAASQFQEVSRSLGSTGEKWNPVVEQSTRVAQHAQDVLAAE